MNFQEILKARRKALGYTLKDIAERVGVTEATVQRWESGNIKSLRQDRISLLADILEVSPAYLMGWSDEQQSQRANSPDVTEDYTTFAVIGEVAAGYNHPALEDWEGDTVDIPNSYLKGRNYNDFFVLRVKGDSMYPVYQDGDKVLVLKQTTLNYSGQVGVVLYDDELSTLKKVEYTSGEDWMRLIPINPAYPPIRIENEQLEHCRILGIPRLLIREINE